MSTIPHGKIQLRRTVHRTSKASENDGYLAHVLKSHTTAGARELIPLHTSWAQCSGLAAASTYNSIDGWATARKAWRHPCLSLYDYDMRLQLLTIIYT